MLLVGLSKQNFEKEHFLELFLGKVFSSKNVDFFFLVLTLLSVLFSKILKKKSNFFSFPPGLFFLLSKANLFLLVATHTGVGGGVGRVRNDPRH